MADTIRVLIIEDFQTDAELEKREVEKALPGSEFLRVETREDFLAALESFKPDLILSDYKLPRFDGMSALKLARELVPETPFIVITSALGEEAAVGFMKEGAWDYIIKEHIKRLGPTVLHCLERKRLKEEKRRAEEAIEKERKRMEVILSAQDTGLSLINPDMTIAWVNQKIRKMFPGREPVGQQCHVFYESRETICDNCGTLQAFMNGNVCESEQLVPATGRWYYIISQPIMDTDGRVVNVLEGITDITERKQAEERLVKSKKEWERTFDAIEDPLMILDTRYRIIKANRATAEKLGITQSAAEGLTCYEQVHGTTAPPGFCPHATLLSDGKSHSVGIKEERLGGYCDVSVSPLYGPDGKLYGSVHIARDINERIKMEESLRESEARHRTILETLQTGIVIIDPDTHTIVDLNPAAAKMIGETMEQIIGSVCHRYICPAEEGKCPITDLKQPVDNEERVLLKADGTDMPIIKTVSSIILGGRRLLIESFMDITGRKQAEEALRQSEEQYRSLVETTDTGYVIIDQLGRVLDANQEYIRLSGHRDLSEIRGRSVIEWTAAYEKEKNAKAVEKCAREGYIRNLEIDYIDIYGKVTPVEINATVMATGGMLRILTLCHDITERKQSEEELKKLSHKIGLILNSAVEGIYGIDLAGNVTFINPAAANMLGYEVEEPIGRQSHAAWHHSGADGTPFPVEQCPLDKVLKEGGGCLSENTVFWKKDGTQFPVEYSSTPMFEAGKLVGAVVTFRDITSHLLEEQERKQLEEQLRHAQKMEAVGTLAGGIAHDFNNILSVIIGYGYILLESIGGDPRSKELMTQILAAADRAANLTRRLLIFSRKQVVEVKPVNVNEIVIGMEKMLSRIIREDIAFALELTSRKMIVMADAGQMEQVLMNLVSNARHAMQGGGKLTISTGIKNMDEEYAAAYGYGKAGRYACISVTDTGSGMDEQTREKIFEPFFTTKEIGEGTGLGLAIVYGIIKQHEGYINVYSEPGKGTEFKIYLPLIEEEAAKRGEVEATPAKGGTETILLAEDDAELRTLSRTVLESFGYTVITADDGEEAVSRYMENRDKIALLLLDMIMPKKNGKEAYAEIKNIKQDIKALFVSGYTMDSIHQRELLDNGLDLITKPVSPIDLVKKVREALDR